MSQEMQEVIQRSAVISIRDQRFVEYGTTCILTCYDMKVATTDCTQCVEKWHILCEVAREEDLEDEDKITFSP